MSPSSSNAPALAFRHFIGLFLLSLATLLFELALTRVLSVSLWYHFGFLVISTALLGFGASGVTLALWTGLRERANQDLALGICGLAFALSVVFSFWLMQHIPFEPFSIAVDRRQIFFMPVYLLVVALPFFCSGLVISLLLTRGSAMINRLYAYDLVGAGAGCALIAVILPTFRGTGSVLVAAFAGSVAAVCFGWKRRQVCAPAIAIALALLPLTVLGERILPIHVSANKANDKWKPIYSAWNTLSQVDVLEFPADGKAPAERLMIIDAGTAATGITDLRAGVSTVLTQHPEQVEALSMIAYAGKERPNVLIIGSGGGDQVLSALKAHAGSITAVEINSIINDIVARRMNDFWGNLYHQPEVHLVTDEGRSFVRRSKEKYDAIISVHTISNAAVASGAMSLAESYVLTREAFEDYLDHLTPDGTIFFTRPEFQVPRLFSTAREVFEERGLGSIGKHVFAFSEIERRRAPGRAPFVSGFLLKRSEFTSNELREIRAILQQEIGPGKDAVGIKVLYSPDESSVDSIYAQIVGASGLKSVLESNDSQLAAATDDKPFFNQHMRWSRIRWNTIVDLFSQSKPFSARMALEDRPIAEVTLIMLLLQSGLVAALCILLPLFALQRHGLAVEGRWSWLAYFAALGLGFMMIEIALLQRFLLFLGQPIYTYAIVLAGLLISTGVGSHVAGRWTTELNSRLRRVFLSALIVVPVTAALTPPVFHACLGFAIYWRILIALLLVAPLGFVLGMPFPLGLRLALQQSSALGAWAWGVNGFFTVLGTVLALILGMIAGFRVVLLVAFLCYAWGLLAVYSLSRNAAERVSRAGVVGELSRI